MAMHNNEQVENTKQKKKEKKRISTGLGNENIYLSDNFQAAGEQNNFCSWLQVCFCKVDKTMRFKLWTYV